MRMPRFFRKKKKRRSQDHSSRLDAVTRQISQPFRQLWQWIVEARQKRSYRNLWLGIPAGLLGIVALTIAMVARLKADDVLPTYRRLAIKHFESGNLSQARTYLERVYRSGDTSDDVRYFLAETLQAQGQEERARALFESLSPDDSYGYPEAHLLKAKGILAASSLMPGNDLLAAHHLEASRSKFEESADWLFLQAKLQLMTNQQKTGLKFLRAAAQKNPRFLYDLAVVCRELQERDLYEHSEIELAAARDQFSRFLDADPKDPQTRLRLGELLTSLGEFDQAREVLKIGLGKDRKTFGPAIAQVYLTQHDSMLRESTEPLNRLEMLKYAVRADPKCVEAVRRLAFFGEEPGATAETRVEAIRYLQGMVTSGIGAPLAHLALGSKAWADNKSQEAMFHLNSAYELDPTMSVLANNLAWVIAHQKVPQLEHALSIINSVLKKHPNVAAYRDTRGQILIKMQRWDDALKDLQFALREMPNSPDLHGALSLAYMNMKPQMTEIAENHRRIQEQLVRGRKFGRP